jgi:hypothetical protein
MALSIRRHLPNSPLAACPLLADPDEPSHCSLPAAGWAAAHPEADGSTSGWPSLAACALLAAPLLTQTPMDRASPPQPSDRGSLRSLAGGIETKLGERASTLLLRRVAELAAQHGLALDALTPQQHAARLLAQAHALPPKHHITSHHITSHHVTSHHIIHHITSPIEQRHHITYLPNLRPSPTVRSL